MNHKDWRIAGVPAMPQVMGTDDCCVAYYAFRHGRCSVAIFSHLHFP